MTWQAGGFDPSQAVKGHLRDILIPSCITLTGSLMPLVLNWVRDRDIEARRVRLVDNANKHVLFWKSWFEAMVSVAPDTDPSEWRARAQQHLMVASGMVEVTSVSQTTLQTAARTADHFDTARDGLPRWRRWLLLYTPPRPLAWIPRVVFYVYVFFTVVLGLAGLPWILSGFLHSPADVLMLFFTRLVEILLVSLFALVFRWLSLLLERPKRNPAPPLAA